MTFPSEAECQDILGFAIPCFVVLGMFNNLILLSTTVFPWDLSSTSRKSHFIPCQDTCAAGISFAQVVTPADSEERANKSTISLG